MAVQVNSGKVTASISTMSSSPVLFINGAPASNTVTLGTVPANRRWRIVYVYMSDSMAGQFDGVQSYVTLGSAGIVMKSMNNGLVGTASMAISTANFNLEACPILAATETVTATCDHNVGITYVVVGYVEDVV